MSNLIHDSISDSIKHDLAKCRPIQGYKPAWVLAAENNAKPKRVIIRKVATTRHLIGVN